MVLALGRMDVELEPWLTEFLRTLPDAVVLLVLSRRPDLGRDAGVVDE